MEITIEKNNGILGNFDDGCREVEATITLASNLPTRRQRETVIYEALAAMLGYVIPHNQLLDITNTLMDALDQVEE